MATNSVLVHFAGNEVSYNTNASEILETLRTHFKHCMGEGLSNVANYAVHAEADGGYSACIERAELFSHLDFETALRDLMQDTLLRLNGASRTELIFHAAALARHGDATILCGGSGSGKSSLAAWLTASGMQYMTDEVISLPVEGGKISGLCRSLVLKPGSAFIRNRWLKNVRSGDLLVFNDNSAWVEPALLNPDGVQMSAGPRLLIFPHYERGARFRVKRLTSGEALFRLLQHLVNARNLPGYGMVSTAELARQVNAYDVTYSNAETASKWIQETSQ